MLRCKIAGRVLTVYPWIIKTNQNIRTNNSVTLYLYCLNRTDHITTFSIVVYKILQVIHLTDFVCSPSLPFNVFLSPACYIKSDIFSYQFPRLLSCYLIINYLASFFMALYLWKKKERNF